MATHHSQHWPRACRSAAPPRPPLVSTAAFVVLLLVVVVSAVATAVTADSDGAAAAVQTPNLRGFTPAGAPRRQRAGAPADMRAAPSTGSLTPRDAAARANFDASAPFLCDQNRVIDAASVNDDYCDCIDGSDEPGSLSALVPSIAVAVRTNGQHRKQRLPQQSHRHRCRGQHEWRCAVPSHAMHAGCSCAPRARRRQVRRPVWQVGSTARTSAIGPCASRRPA